MSYDSFIVDKLSSAPPSGVDGDFELIAGLFPHQVDLVSWALRRGRAAIFADTGLGKTRMQVAWADVVHKHTGGDILILAPLAVAQQTVAEAADCGVSITHAREADEVTPGINITNYDRLHKFDCSRFVAVVLDESSVIKHHTSKTLQMLLDAFRHTPYKLCATATPAPNDWTELGTHAEFLGIRSRAEMLAEFFVHDGGDTQTWRLKGHARQLFWKWVATWGAMLLSPADLGHNADGYKLPPLQVHQHYIEVEHDHVETGTLFAMEATDLTARRKARKQSLAPRVEACVLHIKSAVEEKWIIWCDLNEEQDAIEAGLRESGISFVSIRGSTDNDLRIEYEREWRTGSPQVLISKSSIFGWGLNWQHCRNVAFVGVTDSWESYYQAVRRCYRFGQKRDVHVHIFSSEQEGAVVANLERKEKDAIAMADALALEVMDSIRGQIIGQKRETNPYKPTKAMTIPNFLG